jgi:putative nucleotidyltransferase with HDIG domain
MNSAAIETLINDLGDLPPLNHVATQIIHVSGDPGATMNDLRQIIITDQALSSQILKVANSALFGMRRGVSTISQAIMTLGFSTIKSIAIASSTKAIYSRAGDHINGTSSKFPDRLLWDHALFVALASASYGKSLKVFRGEELFLCGLLHDIGKVVLATKFRDQYGPMIDRANTDAIDLSKLEKDAFGFDHAMVGEALLFSWGLPESLALAVRYHHTPLIAPESIRPVSAITAIANHLAHIENVAIGQMPDADAILAYAIQALGKPSPLVADCLETVLEATRENTGVFDA